MRTGTHCAWFAAARRPTLLCRLLLLCPGGHWQWKPKYKANATAAEKADPLPDIMMLTTDIALLEDPKYLELVKLYANDLDALTRDFGSGARMRTAHSSSLQCRPCQRATPACSDPHVLVLSSACCSRQRGTS